MWLPCLLSLLCALHVVFSIELNCDDWQECKDMSFPESQLDSNIHVDCNGASSCLDSVINAESDINCNGYTSCSGAHLQSTTGSIYCNGPLSCKTPYTLSTQDGQVSCSGDHACLKTEIANHGKIVCDGSNACKRAKLSAADSIAECSGYYACSEAEMTDANHIVTCNGLYGCNEAEISVGVGEVRCYGSTSCNGAKIRATLVQGYGEHSLQSATLMSDVLNQELTVEAFGYEAGKGASMLCRCGDTCSLKCAGNGCFEMHLTCERGSVCTYDCDATSGVACPLVIDETRADDADNNDFQCPTIDHNVADAARLPLIDDDDADVDDSTEAVTMCRYHNECSSPKDGILATIPLRCTGYQACAGSAVDALTSVECAGYQSCYAASSLETRRFKNGGDELNVLRCTGYAACSEATQLHSFKNLLCSGPDSCAASRCVEVTEINKLLCDGPTSCSMSTLVSDALAQIQCNGRNACVDADIEAGYRVLCNGHKGCMGMDLVGRHSFVECGGMNACSDSTILAKQIDAFGYKALNSGTIKAYNNSVLLLQAHGYYAGYGANVNCDAGADCTVSCMNKGCAGLTFDCADGATCQVKCDANTDECPRINDLSTEISNLEELIVGEAAVQSMNTLHNTPTMYIVFAVAVVTIIVLIACYSSQPHYKREEYFEI